MSACPLKCKNVKLLFKGEIGDRAKYENAKKDSIFKNGYSILKLGNIVFTLYSSSQQVINCTGIRSILDLNFAKKFVTENFGFVYTQLEVSNSLFTFKIDPKSTANMFKFFEEFPLSSYFYKYQSESFPGIFFKSKKKECPTAVLFNSGKVVIIGGKSPKNVLDLYQYLLKMNQN